MSTENSADIPVVTLVLEGGPNTLQTAAEAMESGTAVVVFAGSGRAADFISAAFDNKWVTCNYIDSVINMCAAVGLFLCYSSRVYSNFSPVWGEHSCNVM